MRSYNVVMMFVLLTLSSCLVMDPQNMGTENQYSEVEADSPVKVLSNQFGFHNVSGPTDDNNQISLTVTADTDLDLIAYMLKEGEESTAVGVSIITADTTGRLWLVRPIFPEIARYKIIVAGKPKGDPSHMYTNLVEWQVTAETARPEAAGIPILAVDQAPPPQKERIITQEEITEALITAVENRDLPGIKTILEDCIGEYTFERTKAQSALASILFDTDPRRCEEVLHTLLTAGMDPNMFNNDENPIIYSAVEKNRIDVATLLLENGASINARGRYGTTAIHTLSADMEGATSYKDWLKLFMEYGADLNARTDEGDTLLCWVAQYDWEHELLVLLIENGADFNLANEEGNAPLSYATQHGAKENADYLTSLGARMYSYSFPTDNDDPVSQAVLTGDIPALHSIPPEEFTRMVSRTSLMIPSTPLHLAVEQGKMPVLRSLCSMGVNWNVPDRYGRSPLQLAVKAVREDITLLLLDSGADPNYHTDYTATPFIEACSAAPALAMKILSRGFIPEGETLGKVAIASEDLALVKAMDRVIEWDTDDLKFASQAGFAEITEFLSTRVTPAPEGLAEYISQARENRARNEEYLSMASRPIEAPRRNGGIADMRGTFPYVVDSWSPWLKDDTVNLADYPVGIYVPETYDGTKPFGLVVSMTNAKSSSPYPRTFTGTLDKHDLIWVGFDPYNGMHTPFLLALVYNMLGYYNIDQSRIYIGGYSLGGQKTDAILHSHPWIFDGAFFINMNFHSLLPWKPEWYFCKHRIPIVFAEGDYDYCRLAAYASCDQLIGQGYRSVHICHEPMKGHRLISAERFETIITLLDSAAE